MKDSLTLLLNFILCKEIWKYIKLFLSFSILLICKGTRIIKKRKNNESFWSVGISLCFCKWPGIYISSEQFCFRRNYLSVHNSSISCVSQNKHFNTKIFTFLFVLWIYEAKMCQSWQCQWPEQTVKDTH